ncbi:MAG: trimeric intracellular cation channel family protein [Alphaproteobacteria bacterium]|nr:trimeric intracellular cation channel family protein [Alphaproteobacteria bacterium]
MDVALAVLTLLGTAVFAASGALVAAEKGFDLIGAVFLSVAAGLGGGTIADLLVGGPVRWLTAPEPLWAALVSAVVVFEAVRFGAPPEKTLVWADAVGLALFTATGMQRLSGLHLDVSVTIFLVAIAASGGGIVRDVLANRAPLVFTGEIYVTAAVLGALAYYGVQLSDAGDGLALFTALAVTFLVRAAGIRFAIRLLPGKLAP